ncbi:MAG: hypothetical protein HZA46_24850 [Planctomycetales bacterium]|nr:hypothetical protein [Planctomycetales bacterium]
MRTIRTVLLSAAVLAGLLLDVGQSQAAPIFSLGDMVGVEQAFPTTGTVIAGPTTVAVVAGPELLGFAGAFNLDLSPGNIVIDFSPIGAPVVAGGVFPADFNGTHIFDSTGTLPAFLTLVVDPTSTVVGFDATRVTFDGNNIFLNFAGLTVGGPGSFVSLGVVAAPEPASLALWSMGAIGMAIGATRRKRRTQSV